MIVFVDVAEQIRDRGVEAAAAAKRQVGIVLHDVVVHFEVQGEVVKLPGFMFF
jgi:hypothetical protein